MGKLPTHVFLSRSNIFSPVETDVRSIEEIEAKQSKKEYIYFL